MAPFAISVVNQPAALLDIDFLGCQAFYRVGPHLAPVHAQQRRRHRVRILIAQTELGHTELVVEQPHLALIEDAGLFELFVEPVVTRIGYGVGIAVVGGTRLPGQQTEIQLVHVLAAFLGQFRADGLGIFESRNEVASETALPGDDLLAQPDVALMTRHLSQLLPRGLHGQPAAQIVQHQIVADLWVRRRHLSGFKRRIPTGEQIGRDIGRLPVGQPQIRHPGIREIGRGILQPCEQPARRQFAANFVQVGAEIPLPVFLAQPIVRTHHVAGLASHHFDETFAPTGVALHRRRGVYGTLGLLENKRHNSVDRCRIALDILRPTHVGQIENLGHLGGRAKPLGIPHPLNGPFTIQLTGRLAEIRADPAQIPQRMPGDFVAAVATQRAHEMDTAIQIFRPGYVHNARVALSARRLDVAAGQHGVVPVFHFLPSVQLFPAGRLNVVARGVGRILERHAPVATEMTGCAPRLIDRVG